LHGIPTSGGLSSIRVGPVPSASAEDRPQCAPEDDHVDDQQQQQNGCGEPADPSEELGDDIVDQHVAMGKVLRDLDHEGLPADIGGDGHPVDIGTMLEQRGEALVVRDEQQPHRMILFRARGPQS